MKTLNEIGKAVLARLAKSLNAKTVFEPKVDSISMCDEYPNGCDIYAWDWQYGLTSTDYSTIIEWCSEINKGVNSVTLGEAFHLFSSTKTESDSSRDLSCRSTNVRFSHFCLHNPNTNELFIYRITNGIEKLKKYCERLELYQC